MAGTGTAFVSTLSPVTANDPPAAITLTDLGTSPGPFCVALAVPTGGVTVSIVDASDRTAPSALQCAPGASNILGPFGNGDATRGLWLYAASSQATVVTLLRSVS